jgi:hypothetical protein
MGRESFESDGLARRYSLLSARAKSSRKCSLSILSVITTHGDLEQGVVLDNNDIIFVPRSVMGDVNDVVTKIEPLLNVLLIPATYRDLYTAGGGLRVDTGDAAATGTTTGFTRPLPGVGKLAVPVEDEEQQEEDREAVEE